MKKIIKESRFWILTGSVMLLVAACSKENAVVSNNTNNAASNLTTLVSQINALPSEPLSDAEINSLVLMREEEKLARDVYRTLYDKWGATIFNNIASSEQTHTDAVLLLLNKYHLQDPVISNSVGVFSNPALQNLYTELVAMGTTNILAGYKVGATIEDLDIFDLEHAQLRIDNQDIKLVYDMLTKGSRNHMRSFYKNILSQGGTYTAQYITQVELEAIINSSMETGY